MVKIFSGIPKKAKKSTKKNNPIGITYSPNAYWILIPVLIFMVVMLAPVFVLMSVKEDGFKVLISPKRIKAFVGNIIYIVLRICGVEKY